MNSERQINEKLAQEDIDYARKHIQHAHTFPWLTLDEISINGKKIVEVRLSSLTLMESLKLFYTIPDVYKGRNLHFAKIKIANVKRYPQYLAGACDEMAYFVLNYLIKHGSGKSIFVVSMDKTHTVVLFDLAEGFDINNPDTWGDQAIVIDAWKGKGIFYPGTREYLLNNLKGLRYDNILEINTTYPYDPKEHLLHIEVKQEGNDVSKKKLSRDSALSNINLIFKTIINFPHAFPLNFLDELQSTQKSIENSTDDELMIFTSNHQWDGYLTKKIYKLIKDAINFLDTQETKNKLMMKLIENQINEHYFINNLNQYLKDDEITSKFVLRLILFWQPEEVSTFILERIKNKNFDNFDQIKKCISEIYEEATSLIEMAENSNKNVLLKMLQDLYSEENKKLTNLGVFSGSKFNHLNTKEYENDEYQIGRRYSI